MKRIYPTLILAMFCFCCLAQKPAILYSSNQPVEADSVGMIKRIVSPAMGRNLKIVYTNGEKRKVPKKEVWGFIDRRGRMFRSHGGNMYRVIMRDDFVKYERAVPGTHNYQWRYSADLESPLYWSKRKAKRAAQAH